MTIEFRDFEPSDGAIAIELLSHGAPLGFSAAKRATFDWQFFANPHRDERSPFIIGTVEGEVAAFSGYMPARLRYQGRPLASSWICDIHVVPKFRGQGFGKELVSRASKRAPVMLAYGISDMGDPLLAKFRWIPDPNLRIWFFHVNGSGIKGVVKSLRTRMARLRKLRARSHRLDLSWHEEDFGPEVEELWQRSAPNYFSCVERDAAYLNWKYRRHPLHRYEWVAARKGGRLRGLLVMRHSTAASVLVDYCGPAADVDVMSELISAATETLAERGTTRVQCETAHAPMLEALNRNGFMQSRFCSRFRVHTNLEGDKRQVQDWFLMTGDSDGDMIVSGDQAMPG